MMKRANTPACRWATLGLALLLCLTLTWINRPQSLWAEEDHDQLVTGYIDGQAFDFDLGALKSRTAVVRVQYKDQVLDLLHFRPDEKVYIASLTKIMTGYAAYKQLLEAGHNLDDKATVRPSDLQGLADRNASMAGFQTGEQVSFRDLFYGLFLSSGCDAANTLARETSGSQANFIEVMTEEAARLGLKNTHFSSTSGLFEVDNYSSVSDIAQLMLAAREEDFLRQVMETRYHQCQESPAHPQGLTLVHSLNLYAADSGLDSSVIDGAKTGQLKEAGYCLASFKEVDDLVIIIVTCGAEDAGDHVADHLALYQALLDQIPPEGDYEIGGIGQPLPLTGQSENSPPEKAPGSASEDESGADKTLTYIAIGLLALLLTLGLILLVSLLIRRRMEKEG